MAKECIIEYYFRTDQLLKMLTKHPGAKGIIVSQRLVATTMSNGKTMNIVDIKARVDKLTKPKKTKVTKAGKPMGDPPDDGSIDGCPYPPGCGDGNGG